MAKLRIYQPFTTFRVHTLETPLYLQSLLRMQPMLKNMLNAMTYAKQRSVNAKKFILYSGHDLTIRPLLRALSIPDYK